MTMSKLQFAALLLTVSVVGIGVGWLPHWILKIGKEIHPQVTVTPVVMQSEPHANYELKALYAALLAECKARQNRETKLPAAAEVKEPLRYQGKPASEWLAMFRDRDAETREKAIDPLVSIAEVDRSVIPALIEGLKDKESDVQEAVAKRLERLNAPARETVPLLFLSDLSLETLLPVLLKIDPRGEVAVPLARSALQDKKLGLRAGFILLAFDKNASLPVPLLVQALEASDNAIYAVNADGEPQWCSQRILAAWHLRRLGQEVPSAVPGLVKALESPRDSYNSPGYRCVSMCPFSSLNLDNEADCFGATLTRVDREGKQALPLLLKMLGDRRQQQGTRCDAARALGHYGTKAKSAVAALRDLLKDDEALKPAPSSSGYGMPATYSTPSELRDPMRDLQETITVTLSKIAPTKEPPK
jgi:HEAT repeat protein